MYDSSDYNILKSKNEIVLIVKNYVLLKSSQSLMLKVCILLKFSF